jgi:hypothetical protein
MRLLDILRKLGVVRRGATAGTYTDAKRRPTELQMDGVLDAERDLVTTVDGTAAAATLAAALKTPGGKRILTIVLVLLGIFAVLAGLALFGSSGGPKTPSPEPVVTGGSTAPPAPAPAVTAGTAAPAADPNPAGEGAAAVKPAPLALSTAKTSSPVSRNEAAAPRTVSSGGSPLKDWNPRTGEEAAAGPTGLAYDKYVNAKFGFVTELPAHWESQVKDNAHVFSGPKGADEYEATVNFQIITRKAGSTLKNEADGILSRWKAMSGFSLDQTNEGDMNGNRALYMVASYELPGGRPFRQFQAIIDREPFYYMVGYTAPQTIFMKYYFVIVHLLGTFQFTKRTP